MEVLQCDSCDFRAESYDDLKTHIQEVHTAFLQPADADESDSMKDEDEDEEDVVECEEKHDKDEAPPKPGMSMATTLISMLQFNCQACFKYLIYFLFFFRPQRS